jgi:predicted transport protein
LKLREKIVTIDEDIKEVPKKQYIAYKISTNFADVILYKEEIRITLNVKSGRLNDPLDLATDFTKPKKGHWGNGDYEVKLKNETELDGVFELIKQSYDLNK